MFADELRRAVETAPRITLPSITALLWRAFGAGQVSEDEAAEIEALIEVRKGAPKVGETPTDRVGSPRKPTGSRPRTSDCLARRRRWAASGWMPPAIAARFTTAEQAVLAIVAVETTKRGDCRLAIGHIAAAAGVSRSTVKAAIRQARMLGLASVEERRRSRFRSETNVVRITSPEWTAWLRLVRCSPDRGSGVKFATSRTTEVLEQRRSRPSAAAQRLPKGGERPERTREHEERRVV